MAFWMFDKLSKTKDYVQKNFGSAITQILNINDQKPPPQNPFTQKPIQPSQQSTVPTQTFFQIIPKPPLPVSFETQLHEYEKLCKIEQEIVKKMKRQEFEKYDEERKVLEKKLREVEQKKQRDQMEKQKEEIYKKMRTGELNLEAIIQDNLVMKERIQEIKLGRSYRNSV